MLYFLYGADTYRSKQKLHEMVAAYQKANSSGMNLLAFDAAETEFKEFFNRLNTQSMFDKKKLAVVRGVFADKDFQEGMVEQMDALVDSQDIVVVRETEKADERTKFFKALVKKAKCQAFEPLALAPLKKWIALEFEKYHAKADAAAVDLLAQSTGSDLWRLSQEIQKLANYRQGGAVAKEDVALQVRAGISNDIFKTVDALGTGDKRQSLALLKKHLEGGDNAFYLLSMVAYQLRNFLIIRELLDQNLPYPAVVAKSKLHPFVAQKSIRAVSRFPLDRLKTIYRKLLETDAKIKTGLLEPELALDLLVAEI